MKKFALYFLLSSFIPFFNTLNFNVSAQVTIGSSVPPVEGALLDLREYDDTIAKRGGRTAERGLMLPRVELTSSMGDLGKTLDTTLTSIGFLNPIEHIGLLVYNLRENKCISPILRKGVHVWDGTQWVLLNNNEDVLPTGVFRETDPRDGEVYLARDFGQEAGVWMLENLRYNPKLYPDVEAGFDGSTFIHSATGSVTDKVFYYPIGIAYTPSDREAPEDWDTYKKNGLLYNWVAATNGQNLSTDNQAEDIQGICPQGWHIPSDKEWSILERHIYENAQDYSTYQQSDVNAWAPWETTWETSSGFRPLETNHAHGSAMKSQCMLTNTSTGGSGYHALDGGFNVLLTGYSKTHPGQYGLIGYFWTSSSSTETSGWCRIIGRSTASVYRDKNSKDYLFSVRCKKK